MQNTNGGSNQIRQPDRESMQGVLRNYQRGIIVQVRAQMDVDAKFDHTYSRT